jgi:hypothetical protein
MLPHGFRRHFHRFPKKWNSSKRKRATDSAQRREEQTDGQIAEIANMS